MVNGHHWPILVMEWVQAKSFLAYVEKNKDDSNSILLLARSFRSVVLDLEKSGLAHGDLQHDNILVTDEGKIRLA